jgi:hypothetical protein
VKINEDLGFVLKTKMIIFASLLDDLSFGRV